MALAITARRSLLPTLRSSVNIRHVSLTATNLAGRLLDNDGCNTNLKRVTDPTQQAADLKEVLQAADAVLVVNTASFCGLTPQLEGLEDEWNKHAGRLAIVAIPCNDFGAQEPLSQAELLQFYTKQYRVTFPVVPKAGVKEDSATPVHPLYQALRDEFGDAIMPKWNFHKFLLNKSGELASAFPHTAKVTDDDMQLAIKHAMK